MACGVLVLLTAIKSCWKHWKFRFLNNGLPRRFLGSTSPKNRTPKPLALSIKISLFNTLF